MEKAPTEDESPESKSIGAAAARGMAWSLAETVVIRGANMLRIFLMGLLLTKEDFGLFAMVYSVWFATALLQDAGVSAVLIQRADFKRFATAGFSLSVAQAVLTASMAAIAAPIMGWFYGEPRLVPLILVLAAGIPLRTITLVPKAKLTSEMRFKAVSFLMSLDVLLVVILSLVFAYAGFGAYSFVLPLPVSNLILAIVWWRLARVPLRRKIEFRVWPQLLKDSLRVLVANLAGVVINQADFVILGRVLADSIRDATMGAYFFAFVYARQVVNEIQGRLIRVLFPALTKMSDQPQRQLRAFISAARLVMIVILPLTLLQVALAGPIVRLIYPDGKWDAAIPLMQLLSFAMAVRGLAGPSESLLQAQGRFKAHMNTHWLFAGLLTIAVLVAVNIDSALSTPVRVALALIVVYAFMTQVRLQVALSPWGLSLTSSLRIWLPVFSIGVVSFGAVWWSTIQVKASDLQSIFIVPAVGLTIYLGFVRAFLPSSFQDVLNRIKSVLVRDQ